MAKVNFQEFSVMDFLPRSEPGFVYVLSWVSDSEEAPFYVGQTQSIWGRLNDYYWAQFQASTDFRVGEAIKHLHARNLRIVVRYRASANPREEERAIIDEFQEGGRRLLNGLRGFDYRTANQDDERVRVQRWVDSLVEVPKKDRTGTS